MSRIDARYDQTADIAHKLWDWTGTVYQEERSRALLQDTLRAEGFTIRKGVAEIPTAFVGAPAEEARGPDYRYSSLLGDREPPLDYRKWSGVRES